MKILLLHTHDYWLKPFEKRVASAEGEAAAISCRDAVLALVHVEAADESSPETTKSKAIKNITWHARKVGSEIVVLHAFSHLSASQAELPFARELIRQIAERLAGAGFTVQMTPIGFDNEFKLHVAGPSIAKVFVDL